MAVETTNTMIERGSATAPVLVVNVSAPVRACITCPPFRVSVPKPHVRRWGGTTPSTTSMMPLDQVWCELLRTPSRNCLKRGLSRPPSAGLAGVRYRKVPIRTLVRPRFGHLQDFSDSFITEFSEVRTAPVVVARIPASQIYE